MSAKKGSEVAQELKQFINEEFEDDDGVDLTYVNNIINKLLDGMVVIPEGKWNEVKTLILNPPDPYGTPYWDVNLRVLKEWQDKLRKAVE